MKQIASILVLSAVSFGAFSQEPNTKLNLATPKPEFTIIKNNQATPVKNQGNSGTCWCFATTSLVESEMLSKKEKDPDLSEVYTVYNLYIDKAEKYIRRRGNTRFTEGGIQQDVMFAADNFGSVPQEIYPGVGRDTVLNHDGQMETKLKAYLDDLLKNNPDTIPASWKVNYKSILNSYLGEPPATFTYNGKTYTPKTYAEQFVPLKLSGYIGLTSFQHHPYNTTFAIEVPDNYNSNMFYNLPLDEFIKSVKAAVLQGYTVAWDADVSNKGFQMKKGFAKWVDKDDESKDFATFTEKTPTAEIRQDLFDRQVTQDDHLMQITGLAKDSKGNEYFLVKNSWGKGAGPFGGYIYVSVPYFAINTISVVVNKKAIPATLVAKVGG
ncbi:C1 family peptidase [Mucilaginibacter lappiensis]|uniref:Aminopeptidase n=1 Tax=Mucilaginibacter lappiensis TaxID=354630 RepID=A0A841JF84_9SPHI|nr:C1 family peptidase [Mucilaginibacter lappiensis]MBB6126731.1 bleomycin hydrolase [Mucilaginibacter lappiensis]